MKKRFPKWKYSQFSFWLLCNKISYRIYVVIITNLKWLFHAYIFVTKFKFSLIKIPIRRSTNFIINYIPRHFRFICRGSAHLIIVYFFSFYNYFPQHFAISDTMCFNFWTVGCFAHIVKKLFMLSRYFNACCDPIIIKYIVIYVLHRKTWVKNN
jgi:hypothetical protein